MHDRVAEFSTHSLPVIVKFVGDSNHRLAIQIATDNGRNNQVEPQYIFEQHIVRVLPRDRRARLLPFRSKPGDHFSGAGGLAAGGLAVVQFWPDQMAIALVLAVFALGQFLEGNFLTPKLIGDRVRLHPVWVMFALFAFGYLFGFVGVLLAVPVAAALGVVTRHGLSHYQESELYLGDDDGV